MGSKKEKHDKSKREKEKKRKSKKSKKNKKESNSICGDESPNHSSSSRLNTLLSIGMVLFPKLQVELSDIVMALDSGKQFRLTESGDPFNSFLKQLLEQLPLDLNGDVWRKSDHSINLRRYILNKLLLQKSVVQPSSLSTSERLAVTAANKIAPLLRDFPSFWKDLTNLLEKFIVGEAVDLSGIEATIIRTGLTTFFDSIGASSDDSGTTFSLPMKLLDDPLSQKDVKKAVRHFINLFEFTKGMTSDLSIEVDSQSSLPNCSSSSSEFSDEESSTSDNDQHIEVSSRPLTKGPTMPSKSELAFAATLANKHALHYDIDESDEDGPEEVGPFVSTVSIITDVEHEQSIPLGGGIFNRDNYDKIPSGSDVTSHPKDMGKIQREEWMLTPGEHMPFGASSRGEPNMPSNRKFDRGKLAKKSAEQLAAQREAEYEIYINSEEGKQAEAVLEEYRKKRGPSLLQKHQENIAAKRSKTGTTSFSEMRKRGFDRERDMSSHRQMGQAQAQKLIDEAKNLDSRFSKSYILNK